MANTALVQTEFGLAHPTPTPGAEDRSICHPQRPVFADGLCETCCQIREKLDAVLATLPEDDTEARPLVAQIAKSKSRQAMINLFQITEFAEGIAEYSRALMIAALPKYVKLMERAAEVASEDGDSRPMEFMLKYAKMAEGKTVVDAPEKLGPGGRSPGVGVQVMIGIATGGLPSPDQLSARVVTVERES